MNMGFALSLAYLALSGLVGWMCDGMTGWWLVLHMVAGGTFAACIVLIAVSRAFEGARSLWKWILWLAWLACAVGTVFTAVMPMMTVYGEVGQEVLLWSHRLCAFAFAGVSGLMCWSGCRKKRD
ncbi:MAG: hypothetical protein IJL17_22445 [Kiritimatiellae bacterium]|nr:hypothetical protein [Kiritimatiellia bacterium]